MPRVRASADILFYAKVKKIALPNKRDDEDEDTEFAKLFNQALKNVSAARTNFKNRNFFQAIDIYRKWINKLENVRLTSDEEEMKQRKLLRKMYLNVCICYNKIKKPEKTCVMMRELEKLESIKKNPKALFAKGIANMMLNNYEYARKFFIMVKELLPGEESIMSAIEELDHRVQSEILHDAEAAELVQRFKDETFEIKSKEDKRAHEQDKKMEKLKEELKRFEVELKEFIIAFKNDQDIKYLSLTINLSSHHHLKLANETCERLGIQLKGKQSNRNDTVDYFLSK